MRKNLEDIHLKFEKIFETDFEILDGVVKPDRYDKNYCLVRVKPKESGFYILNHFFDDATVSKDSYYLFFKTTFQCNF